MFHKYAARMCSAIAMVSSHRPGAIAPTSMALEYFSLFTRPASSGGMAIHDACRSASGCCLYHLYGYCWPKPKSVKIVWPHGRVVIVSVSLTVGPATWQPRGSTHFHTHRSFIKINLQLAEMTYSICIQADKRNLIHPASLTTEK